MRQGIGDQPVSCDKGCSHCCKQWVGVMYLEAKAAVEEAMRVGHDIDIRELHDQAEMGMEWATRKQWFSKRKSCIFLKEDGSCAVWQARPIACRSVLVSSDPKECGKTDGEVKRYRTEKDTFVAYAALQAEHEAQALLPVVAALPLMVALVLKGESPTYLTNKYGVYGIKEDAERTLGGERAMESIAALQREPIPGGAG